MGIKDYFNQTTLHGFRYLVLTTNNAVERAIWFLTITLSFTLAGYMVITNIEDTAKNPVSTSIRTIPIQEVVFPAVTIEGNQNPTAMRLFHDIFDNVEFDCFGSDDGCMERTSKIRSDAAPAVAMLMYSNYMDGNFYASKPLGGGSVDLGKDLCTIGDTEEMAPMRSLALGIAKFYDENDLYFDFELTYEFEDQIFITLAPYFRSPVVQFAAKLRKFLEKFYPDYVHDENITETTCMDTFNKYSERSVKEPVAGLYNSFGYSSRVKMSFGDIMFNAVRTNYAGRQADWTLRGLTITEEQNSFILALKDIFFDLIEPYNAKNGTLYISPKNFFGFFGPEYHVHTNAPVKRNDDPVVCDFTSYKDRDPCWTNSSSMCCQMATELSVERETVLRSMKYSVGPQARYIMEVSEKADVMSFEKKFDYSREEKDQEGKLVGDSPMILACKFGKEELQEDCQRFRKTFTNKGIGYTFNGENFWKLHKDTIGNRAFYEQLVATLKNDTMSDGPYMIEGNGRGFSLDMYLSLDEKGKSLTIHDPATVADIRNEVINLKPGMLHEISIVPSTVVTDEAGLQLSSSKRECLTQSESDDLKIYKTYSQSACLLECQLQSAIDKCKCTPWNYPVYEDSIEYCSSGSPLDCFEEQMDAHLDRDTCDCPNDCSITEYSVATTVTPITDHDVICPPDSSNSSSSSISLKDRSFEEHPYFQWDVDSVNQVPYDCKNYVDNKLSIVRILVAPRTVNKIERTRRTTFSDQLASLGGIIGLFSGMSIISLAELIFWLIRSLSRWLVSWTSRFPGCNTVSLKDIT